MQKFLDVTEMETGEVVHSVEVTGKTERQVDKVLAGMLTNMDRDRFVVGERASEEV